MVDIVKLRIGKICFLIEIKFYTISVENLCLVSYTYKDFYFMCNLVKLYTLGVGIV